jgi:hypothetical protein
MSEALRDIADTLECPRENFAGSDSCEPTAAIANGETR